MNYGLNPTMNLFAVQNIRMVEAACRKCHVLHRCKLLGSHRRVSGGIDAHSLRPLVPNAALRQWCAAVATAFLNIDSVTPNKEVIVVKVPTVFSNAWSQGELLEGA